MILTQLQQIIQNFIDKFLALSWQDAAIYIGIFAVFCAVVLIDQLIGRQDRDNNLKH